MPKAHNSLILSLEIPFKTTYTEVKAMIKYLLTVEMILFMEVNLNFLKSGIGNDTIKFDTYATGILSMQLNST